MYIKILSVNFAYYYYFFFVFLQRIMEGFVVARVLVLDKLYIFILNLSINFY